MFLVSKKRVILGLMSCFRTLLTGVSQKEFRLQEMAVTLQATGSVNGTPHRACFTRADFSRAWLKHQRFVSCLQKEPSPRACFSPCLILHLSRLHSALRPLPHYLSIRTGQIPVHRGQDSRLAVLPNSLRSQTKHGNHASDVLWICLNRVSANRSLDHSAKREHFITQSLHSSLQFAS